MATERKPRRPKPLLYEYDTARGKAKADLAVSKEIITEDKKSGKLLARRDAIVWGDIKMFDGMSNKEQAQLAMKLGIWFFRYSRWIKNRPEGEV